jgi:hypothetical protein
LINRRPCVWLLRTSMFSLTIWSHLDTKLDPTRCSPESSSFNFWSGKKMYYPLTVRSFQSGAFKQCFNRMRISEKSRWLMSCGRYSCLVICYKYYFMYHFVLVYILRVFVCILCFSTVRYTIHYPISFLYHSISSSSHYNNLLLIFHFDIICMPGLSF